MEDKLEEVLKQYPFRVKNRKRARGAILLDTDQGMLELRQCQSSRARLKFEERIKNGLMEAGYPYVDRIVLNQEEEYQSKDRYGNLWIACTWYGGVENDIHDVRAMGRLAEHLGELHRIMHLIPMDGDYIRQEELLDELERHTREIKRVKGYIRSKKQKNEMELCLLQSFDLFFDQAQEALEQVLGYELTKYVTDMRKQGYVCHGSYNYHNVLQIPDGLSTVGFGKAVVDVQVQDLYDFLRKVMEKNEWKIEVGQQIIKGYLKKHELTTGDRQILYGQMLYPEKYWKLVNFYYNGRKSWMPVKNLEKLQKIRAQERERQKFLRVLKMLLF